MHPPIFSPTHLLSDWPECCLEVVCATCKRMTMIPTRLLQGEHGNHPIGALVRRLRCGQCQGAVARAWLVAGMHRACHGGPTTLDWAVEIKL